MRVQPTRWPRRVALVISNNAGSGVLRRAGAAGVATVHLSGRTNPDDLDEAILRALKAVSPDVIARVEVPVLPTDDVASLGERVRSAERGLLVGTLAKHSAQGGSCTGCPACR